MGERTGYYFDVSAFRNSRNVRKMDHECRGLYREILDEIWLHGFITTDLQELSMLTKTPLEVVVREWPRIHDALMPVRNNPNLLTSQRMEEERQRRNKVKKIRAELGRRGGEASGSIRRSKAEAIASTPLKQNEPTQDKTRQDKKEPPIPPSGFVSFWKEYPRKVGKADALKSWLKVRPDEDLELKIHAKLSEAKNSADWQRKRGRFIPHPATWLNQGRWDDEFTPSPSPEPQKPLAFKAVC